MGAYGNYLANKERQLRIDELRDLRRTEAADDLGQGYSNFVDNFSTDRTKYKLIPEIGDTSSIDENNREEKLSSNKYYNLTGLVDHETNLRLGLYDDLEGVGPSQTKDGKQKFVRPNNLDLQLKGINQNNVAKSYRGQDGKIYKGEVVDIKIDRETGQYFYEIQTDRGIFPKTKFFSSDPEDVVMSQDAAGHRKILNVGLLSNKNYSTAGETAEARDILIEGLEGLAASRGVETENNTQQDGSTIFTELSEEMESDDPPDPAQQAALQALAYDDLQEGLDEFAELERRKQDLAVKKKASDKLTESQQEELGDAVDRQARRREILIPGLFRGTGKYEGRVSLQKEFPSYAGVSANNPIPFGMSNDEFQGLSQEARNDMTEQANKVGQSNITAAMNRAKDLFEGRASKGGNNITPYEPAIESYIDEAMKRSMSEADFKLIENATESFAKDKAELEQYFKDNPGSLAIFKDNPLEFMQEWSKGNRLGQFEIPEEALVFTGADGTELRMPDFRRDPDAAAKFIVENEDILFEAGLSQKVLDDAAIVINRYLPKDEDKTMEKFMEEIPDVHTTADGDKIYKTQVASAFASAMGRNNYSQNYQFALNLLSSGGDDATFSRMQIDNLNQQRRDMNRNFILQLEKANLDNARAGRTLASNAATNFNSVVEDIDFFKDTNGKTTRFIQNPAEGPLSQDFNNAVTTFLTTGALDGGPIDLRNPNWLDTVNPEMWIRLRRDVLGQALVGFAIHEGKEKGFNFAGFGKDKLDVFTGDMSALVEARTRIQNGREVLDELVFKGPDNDVLRPFLSGYKFDALAADADTKALFLAAIREDPLNLSNRTSN